MLIFLNCYQGGKPGPLDAEVKPSCAREERYMRTGVLIHITATASLLHG